MKITLGGKGFTIRNGVFDLSCGDLTKDEVSAFCDILKTDSAITELDIGYQQIGSDGATKLAAALQSNNTLAVLRLAHNRIGEDGAIALAAVLKETKTLTTIVLSSNTIPDVSKGITALDKAVLQNKNILHCDYNNISIIAGMELKRRKETLVKLVINLARNEPYIAPISATEFRWLKSHGKAYYDYYLSNNNTISYQAFESKWMAILDDNSCEKFKIKFNYLIPEDLTDFNNSSMLKFHGKFTYDPQGNPIKFEMPKEIIRNMFNQLNLTVQEKIAQL